MPAGNATSVKDQVLALDLLSSVETDPSAASRCPCTVRRARRALDTKCGRTSEEGGPGRAVGWGGGHQRSLPRRGGHLGLDLEG